MISGEEKNTFVVSALGAVGTGKSSLLNAITGEYTFETGNGVEVSNKIKTIQLSLSLLAADYTTS